MCNSIQINKQYSKKKYFNYSFRENKLLDDLIQPSGISIKPNDNLLKDFIKRCKSLDKDIIFNYLIDKLNNYTIYESDREIKSFCVS